MLPLEKFVEKIELARTYIAVELSAGERVVFTDPKIFGKPVNLVSILAEEPSEIEINDGRLISMKRDEAIVMINCMEVASIRCVSGTVKIFATIVPRWMPALFWTRSVTVLGVADAVLSAMQQFYGYSVANVWLPAFKLNDVEIPAGEVWHIGGNMLQSVKNLTVKGTLVLTDSALLHTFGSLLVDGGKVIVEDNAQVVSEVIG